MTTHRNLKPHYAEPKGKSGPVIVVKKGEVMSEPTTEAGNFHDALHADDDPCMFGIYGTCDILDEIRAVQQEARANADRELRELRTALATLADDYWGNWEKNGGPRARISDVERLIGRAVQ